MLVPEAGIEPARALWARGILSPLRLPIPPLRHDRLAKKLPTCIFTSRPPCAVPKRVRLACPLLRPCWEAFLPTYDQTANTAEL